MGSSRNISHLQEAIGKQNKSSLLPITLVLASGLVQTSRDKAVDLLVVLFEETFSDLLVLKSDTPYCRRE